MDTSDPALRSAARRRRPLVVLLVAAAVAALVVLSPTLGRADPVGSYRPPLPPDALTNGCWSLPGGVRLPFAYQVRRDEVVATNAGERRRLVLHYDLISGERAARAVRRAFAEAGVRDVQVRADDFADLRPEALVHGRMTLDLPPSEPERRPACQDPFSTKRFSTPPTTPSPAASRA